MKKSLKILLFIFLFISFILFNSHKTFAANKIVAGWYKTDDYYNMRPVGNANGKVVEKIPPGTVIYVEQQDSQLSNRVIVTYNGKKGSILSANLIKTTAPTNNTSSTTATKASKTTTTKRVTTTATTASTTTNTQSYKTTDKLVMRDENGKVIKSIPKNSIIQVKGKDPKNKNRVIATFQGKTGSVLNSCLVKVSTSSPSTATKATTTTTTTTKATTTSTTTNTQSYKTTDKLVMRNENGKVIKSIPKNSIIQVKGKDPKNKNRVIATYQGKTGSILNSGLAKISTTNSTNTTTTKPTTTASTTASKASTTSTTAANNSDQNKYKYFARIKTKSNFVDKNGKKIMELKPNEFVKVISISSEKAKIEWYNKTGFVPKKNIEQKTNAIFISIEKQTLTLIRDNQIIITTPVVTGCIATKKDTPKGAFSIKDMKKIKNNNPVKLTGTNSDGTQYTSYVDYWMRITDSGVGIHDANRWRSKYGGTIYKKNGSHGCINTPKSAMKTIYENSYKKLAVYIQ